MTPWDSGTTWPGWRSSGHCPPAQRAGAHARAFAQLTARGSHDHRRLAHHAAGCGDRAAVLRHAPLAAARAARLGAHREAAEQFQLALRHHEPPDRQRAALLEQLSYECYLTDQLARARDSWLEALAIYEREAGRAFRRHGAAVAVAAVLGSRAERGQRALRRRRGEHAGAARARPGTRHGLQQHGQLRMLADDNAAALRWGTKAIELARELGDRRDRDARAEQRGHGAGDGRRSDRGPGPADPEPGPRPGRGRPRARRPGFHQPRQHQRHQLVARRCRPAPARRHHRTAPTATSTPGGCT